MKNQMHTIKIFIALAMIAGIIFLYLFYASLTPSHKLNIGTKINDSSNQFIAQFTLIDEEGKRFTADDLKGHLSLIYFGVSYSSDDKDGLRKIEDIIKILKKENIIVQVVFITLDPQYDTSKVLKEYLETIDVKFIGLTGNSANIKQTADQFNVFYEPKKFNPESGEYTLKHTNFVYLISSDGRFLNHYCLSLPKNAY
ncbi:MAG TPA: SCO family protein [Rickettsia endosymbiont of Pyrocoelia pectoralis]|nr:SCO family protein [Rickettsia endosymbiont of Pyrocoelia pectoralis]